MLSQIPSASPLRRVFVAREYPDCAEHRLLIEAVFRHRQSHDLWLQWAGTFGGPSRFQAFFRAVDGEWSVVDETFRRRTFPPCRYATFHDAAWKAQSATAWKHIAYDPWLAHGTRLVPNERQAARSSTSLRLRVLARDEHKCRWCDAVTPLHVDHVVPRRFGGLTNDANCQVLCHRCNQLKRTLDEWHFGPAGRAYRRQLTRSRDRVGIIRSPFRGVA
jgi:5-methylcytosine-specific restriction endonuclease McrA